MHTLCKMLVYKIWSIIYKFTTLAAHGIPSCIFGSFFMPKITSVPCYNKFHTSEYNRYNSDKVYFQSIKLLLKKGPELQKHYHDSSKPNAIQAEYIYWNTPCSLYFSLLILFVCRWFYKCLVATVDYNYCISHLYTLFLDFFYFFFIYFYCKYHC